MQKTYEHEVRHYRNAKKAIKYFYNRHLLTKKIIQRLIICLHKKNVLMREII